MDSVKKEIKRIILNKFKSFMNTDHDILPAGWITDLIKKLNMHEREFFNGAIQELIQAGLVEQVNGRGLGSGLKLTHKGECLLYTT